jgi:hypothetical protein
MRPIIVRLTLSDFKQLNNAYPPSDKSATIGKRAVEIVKRYFLAQNENYLFPKVPAGVDLIVKLGHRTICIEIKGTSEEGIAWAKLGVSGRHSHRNLKNRMLLYRVCGVFKRYPSIFVLKYARDFMMVREARWKISKID